MSSNIEDPGGFDMSVVSESLIKTHTKKISEDQKPRKTTKQTEQSSEAGDWTAAANSCVVHSITLYRSERRRLRLLYAVKSSQVCPGPFGIYFVENHKTVIP